MNHPRPSKPANPARRSRSAQGLTPQQVTILILVAVLGSAALILAAFVLLSNDTVQKTPVPVSQAGAGGSGMPLTRTPPAETAAAKASTPSLAQAIPSLPASCAQAGSGYSQGKVMRVMDGGTLEVQINGNTQRVGYAGIEVPAENELAAQKAHELLDGQVVILVKDVSEQDASGRAARYVFSGGWFVNFELVRQGLGVVQPNSPDQACKSYLEQAEQQARLEHLGLWKPTPVPTRTFVPLVTLDLSTRTACDCSKKYVCSDFRTHAEAQTCLNACNDYSSKLDDDRDGIACENLP
jgi:endonuclease YncB( thermonuclease family)